MNQRLDSFANAIRIAAHDRAWMPGARGLRDMGISIAVSVLQ